MFESDMKMEASSQGVHSGAPVKENWLLFSLSLVCCRGKQERYGGKGNGSQFLLFAYKLRTKRKTSASVASCFCNTILSTSNNQSLVRELLSLWV